MLWLGPQQRHENVALTVFWALVVAPGSAGLSLRRLACGVPFCPFMIYGEVTQKLTQWLFPGSLQPWPRRAAERWGGWFLYGLFVLILIWEEVWHLENTAYLSACLLIADYRRGHDLFGPVLSDDSGAVYLCPIGGMNGMFAKLSITELRAQQGTCSAECTTYQCYKRRSAKKERGQEDQRLPPLLSLQPSWKITGFVLCCV